MLLNGEDLLTLPQAAKQVKRNGRSVAASTLYRWAHKGFRGIRLEVIQAGGLMCTSLAAVNRFFERLTAQRDGAPDPQPDFQARQAEIQARLEKHFGPSYKARQAKAQRRLDELLGPKRADAQTQARQAEIAADVEKYFKKGRN